jgi:TonB-dependent SusC/RagA subfamily outer membrane receptor
MRLPSLSVFACAVLLTGLTGCGSTSHPAESAPPAESAHDETVHLGYDTEPKRTSTAAVETIDPKEERGRSASTLSELLQGSTAGVRVNTLGGNVSVQMRGLSSVYGSNAPLYVLDGTPIRPLPGGTLPGLNPNDVKSITVLKDAAATSLYGSDGSNGVIVIETKSR